MKGFTERMGRLWRMDFDVASGRFVEVQIKSAHQDAVKRTLAASEVVALPATRKIVPRARQDAGGKPAGGIAPRQRVARA